MKKWVSLAVVCWFHLIRIGCSDPTEQEINLSSYAMGITMEPCTRAMWTLYDSANFRQEFAALLTDYCSNNATLCNLIPHELGASFSAENVIFLDGYPLLDFRVVVIRFVVVYPQRVLFEVPQREPLITKPILSNVLKLYRDNFGASLGWAVATYESVPRFDAMTEFMNWALIPLAIAAIALMYGLAYLVTSLGRLQGITLVSTGSSGTGSKDRFREIVLMQQKYWEDARSDQSDESVKSSPQHHYSPNTRRSPPKHQQADLIRDMIMKEQDSATAAKKTVNIQEPHADMQYHTKFPYDIPLRRVSSSSSQVTVPSPTIHTKPMPSVAESPETIEPVVQIVEPQPERKLSTSSTGPSARERRPSSAGLHGRQRRPSTAQPPSFLGNLLRPLPMNMPTSIPQGSRPKAVKSSGGRKAAGGRKTQTKLFFGGVQGRGGTRPAAARYANL